LTTLLLVLCIGARAAESAELERFLKGLQPSEIFPGADRLADLEGSPPVVSAYQGGEHVGFVFLNLDQQREAGTTALLSSHALTEIEDRTDRFAIVKGGSLLVCGTLEELRARARLPVRIRLSVESGTAGTVAERIGNGVGFSRVNDHTIDLHCLNGDKMAVVRRIAELGQRVHDVDILPPGLDQVYAYFAGPEETP
jgi:hypothetical protein